ncbi:hypothetical protein B9Z55_027208 [Caenorhabditis nigoni]|nr:hypothetical protein B9Z55_027208 [Caenorhabditis nigoni]
MAGVFSKVLEFMGFEERFSTQKTPNPTYKDPKFYPRKCLKTGNSILITQGATGKIRIFEFLENSENGFQNHEQCPTCKEYIYVHEEKAKSEDVQKIDSGAIEKASEVLQVGDVENSNKDEVTVDGEIQKSDDVEDSEMASEDVKGSEDVQTSYDVDDSDDVEESEDVKLHNPEKPNIKKCLVYEDLSESDVSGSELSESDISDSENIEFLMGIQKSRLTEETEQTEAQKKLVQKIVASANRGNWYEDVTEDSEEGVVDPEDVVDASGEDVKDSEEDVEDSEGSSEDDWSSEDDTQSKDSDSEDVRNSEKDVKDSEEDVEDSEDDWSSDDDTQWEDSDSEDVEAPEDVQASAEDVEASKKDAEDSEDVKMYYAFNRREKDFLKKLNDFRRESMIYDAYSDDVKDSEVVKASEGDMHTLGENFEAPGDVEDSEEGVRNSGEGIETPEDVKDTEGSVETSEDVVEDSENEWESEDDTQWEESDSEDVTKDSDAVQDSVDDFENSENVKDSDTWTTNLQETIRKLKSPKTDSEVDDDVTRDSSEVVRKFRNLMNEIHEENQRRNEELMKIFK